MKVLYVEECGYRYWLAEFVGIKENGLMKKFARGELPFCKLPFEVVDDKVGSKISEEVEQRKEGVAELVTDDYGIEPWYVLVTQNFRVTRYENGKVELESRQQRRS